MITTTAPACFFFTAFSFLPFFFLATQVCRLHPTACSKLGGVMHLMPLPQRVRQQQRLAHVDAVLWTGSADGLNKGMVRMDLAHRALRIRNVGDVILAERTACLNVDESAQVTFRRCKRHFIITGDRREVKVYIRLTSALLICSVTTFIVR